MYKVNLLKQKPQNQIIHEVIQRMQNGQRCPKQLINRGQLKAVGSPPEQRQQFTLFFIDSRGVSVEYPFSMLTGASCQDFYDGNETYHTLYYEYTSLEQ